MNHSHKGRILALIAGVAFAVGGLTILLDKDLTRPHEWASSQWLTILTVFGTITAGHLMVDASRARHVFAAFGFLILFLSGTVLVVYSSVGRQVETGSFSSMSAEDTNNELTDKRADLKDAKARLAYANDQVQKLMTGKSCSNKACKDWKTGAKDITATIKQLEDGIADLGPRKPVNAQAESMADIAALLHIPGTKAQIVAALLLLAPFLKTLFFEIGSIVSFGFAFRARQAKIIVAANDRLAINESTQSIASVAFQLPEDPEPPKGKRPTEVHKGVIELRNHPVWKAIEGNGGSVSSHRELANILGIDEGAATRRRQEIEDHLQMTKVGKQLRIALRA